MLPSLWRALVKRENHSAILRNCTGIGTPISR
jgi:hypothetical protein